ncbi:MAG: leucine--tRNA ligase [Patescibacteria group bacterium]
MTITQTKFQPSAFETKWRNKWAKDQIYKTPQNVSKTNKKYVLDMFPYPSGAGLHVGHVEGYTATDIFCRYLRMKEYDVLHPMGFDSFGLPAENFAIKTGTHPRITTEQAIETFTNQMKVIGLSYDWDLVLAAHTPEYYKWTQWLFLLMYKRGLAYRKKQAVNWCDGCQTVLANEQVVDGRCERCDTVVVQKEMEQWFFKITEYSERLLKDLDKLDWPESTKAGQRNWIGKSEGINISYPLKGINNEFITVFTTRPDTNFGATFIVCAPDSDFVKNNLEKFPNKDIAEVYIKQSLKKKELERLVDSKEKTGVFTGLYAINGLNNKELPIYIADFALATVGTGCLVGVPGHDIRDFEFAKAMNLPIIRVVVGKDKDKSEINDVSQVQEEEGVMMNSGFLDGMEIHAATKKIMDFIEEKDMGKRVVNYKLRDWLISRQRFWGAPIPMRKRAKSKEQSQEFEYLPVEESELPVMLPMDVEFKPTGKSPLTEHPNFKDREVDTMDTFVDSSWYFLRFAQLTSDNVRENSKTGNEASPFEDEKIREIMNTWCPVDLYVGGAEHTVLHLLYARFFTKVLFDAGFVNFDEPFLKLRHQGIIMGPDHRKMSKRWGNVINPLDVVSQYGADTLRMYEMFMGPLDQMKAWNVESVAGIYRFLTRVWNSSLRVIETNRSETEKSIKTALHKAIKKSSDDIPELRFNTTIAAFMEFLNLWEKIGSDKMSINDLELFLKILAPFAPFMTEEIWSLIGKTQSIHREKWPDYNKEMLVEDRIEVPVQINGKLRGTIVIEVQDIKDQSNAFDLAKADLNIAKYLDKEPKKIIYVPGKILNIIV